MFYNLNIDVIKYSGSYFLVKLKKDTSSEFSLEHSIDSGVYRDLESWLSEALVNCSKKESGDEQAKGWPLNVHTYLIADSILSRIDDKGERMLFNPQLFNKNTFNDYVIGSVELYNLSNDTIGIFSLCKTTSTEGRGILVITFIIQ